MTHLALILALGLLLWLIGGAVFALMFAQLFFRAHSEPDVSE